MAIITKLEFGTQITMPQNQVFALPCDAIARITQSQFGANTFDTSNDPAFGAFVQTGNSQFDVARAFIRCNAGNALVGVVRAG
jgi:hypothetical protein